MRYVAAATEQGRRQADLGFWTRLAGGGGGGRGSAGEGHGLNFEKLSVVAGLSHARVRAGIAASA